jgi:hypothetical protein
LPIVAALDHVQVPPGAVAVDLPAGAVVLSLVEALPLFLIRARRAGSATACWRCC